MLKRDGPWCGSILVIFQRTGMENGVRQEVTLKDYSKLTWSSISLLKFCNKKTALEILLQNIYRQRETKNLYFIQMSPGLFNCYSVLKITSVMTMNKLRLFHQIYLQIISHLSAMQLLLPWLVFPSSEQEHTGASDRKHSRLFNLKWWHQEYCVFSTIRHFFPHWTIQKG